MPGRRFWRLRALARFFGALTILVLTLSIGNHPASAQALAVTGNVTDETGAAIARAQVTLKNAQNKSTQHTASDDAGFYAFSAVQPGEYTLVVEATGFARYEQTPVTAQSASVLRLDVKLKLATVSQSVTIHVDELNLEQVPRRRKNSDQAGRDSRQHSGNQHGCSRRAGRRCAEGRDTQFERRRPRWIRFFWL